MPRAYWPQKANVAIEVQIGYDLANRGFVVAFAPGPPATGNPGLGAAIDDFAQRFDNPMMAFSFNQISG